MRQIRETNLNLPNILTLLRILLIPVFVLIFSTPTVERSLAAAFVFGIAALTDLLDGYLARRRSQVTSLGRLLDPVADKLLVISGLIMLVQFQRVAAWIAIVIIAREITVTGVRAIIAAQGVVMSADRMGKFKVVSQIIAIIFLILHGSITLPFIDLYHIGTVILYISLFLALISGGRYLQEAWRHVSSKHA